VYDIAEPIHPPVEYLMGDFPEARITESHPFVDYCAPFYIKERRDRNRRKVKVYVAIFICLATKAIHIEFVSDLTTDAFIAALRRFISRRGHYATILSDNGTNFDGADKELKEFRTTYRAFFRNSIRAESQSSHGVSQLLIQ
jgi:hypothetical protein